MQLLIELSYSIILHLMSITNELLVDSALIHLKSIMCYLKECDVSTHSELLRTF